MSTIPLASRKADGLADVTNADDAAVKAALTRALGTRSRVRLLLQTCLANYVRRAAQAQHIADEWARRCGDPLAPLRITDAEVTALLTASGRERQSILDITLPSKPNTAVVNRDDWARAWVLQRRATLGNSAATLADLEVIQW